MTIFLPVDASCGLMFNHRRQSKDRVAADFIASYAHNAPIALSEYSQSFFSDCCVGFQPLVTDDLANAAADFYFCEGVVPASLWQQADTIILIRWDKRYPADIKLDPSLLSSFAKCDDDQELQGYSHEKIIIETYKKENA